MAQPRGFTLIEFLIAIAVVGALILSLRTLMRMRGSREANDLNRFTITVTAPIPER